MGPRHLTRQIPSDASFHAVHVRRRCSNLQHGDRVHANVQPVQERSCNQHRYVFFPIRPVKHVLGIHLLGVYTAFAPFAPSSSSSKSFSTLFIQKIVYILANMLTLALGLYKCNSMGLLPMGTGDWLAFETRGPVRENDLNNIGCTWLTLMLHGDVYKSPEISLY